LLIRENDHPPGLLLGSALEAALREQRSSSNKSALLMLSPLRSRFPLDQQ
jgi:hypothetical protein